MKFGERNSGLSDQMRKSLAAAKSVACFLAAPVSIASVLLGLTVTWHLIITFLARNISQWAIL